MSKREMILRECQILWQKLYFAEGVDIDKRVIIRRELKEKLKELIENEKIPIPRKIIKEIAGKDWKKLYYLICDRWGGINYFFFERIWESRGGSPIRKILPNSRIHYTFDKFPSVYLSSTGVKPDLAFFPKIENPDSEKVGELTALITYKGSGEVINKKGDFVNQIYIHGSKNLVHQARMLISEVFGVPKEFFSQIEHYRKKSWRLIIGSQMIGTYFQNLVKVFDLDYDKTVILRPPLSSKKKFKIGFVNGVVKWCGESLSEKAVRIRVSWRKKEILELTRDWAKEIGKAVSKIVPSLKNQLKVIPLQQNKNLLVGYISTLIPPPKGSLVFSKEKKEIGELIDINKTNRKKFLVKIEIDEDFSFPIFIEREYQFFIY